ncbi:MAG TPA: hypothetical protein VF145_06685, partial [Chitinophagaceae bacterium]
TVIQFKSSYGFKRNVLQVELGELFLTEITRRKKKLFDAVRLYAVVLFINEEKCEFTRYQSDPAVISLRTKRIGLEVKCVKKPKLPFVIFIYGAGMKDGRVIDSVDATGIRIIGSGR